MEITEAFRLADQASDQRTRLLRELLEGAGPTGRTLDELLRAFGPVWSASDVKHFLSPLLDELVCVRGIYALKKHAEPRLS